MRPPPHARVAAALVALLGGSLPLSARADFLAELETPFRAAIESGSAVSMLGLAFLAGLATSLTPCVYPMIIVTVGVFGARKASSKLEAAKVSSAFVLGIACLFTPLGVVAALTGDVFGSQLSHPVVLWGLALMLVAFAASMFGAFELDLPAGLKNRLALVGGSGLRGAFLLGLVSALIAAPCTGPVIGVLLTWVGTSGDVALGALSFFVYALGLGLLFWLVGTFSMGLPKSGAWLDGVKSALGVVMAATGLYFVRDFLPGFSTLAERSDALLAGALTAIFVGLALGAVHTSFHDPRIAARLRKGLGIALSVGGLLGAVAYLEAPPPGARIEWLHEYASARKLAATSGRPLLVDFTASWCGACGELDRNTFSDPRVVREGRRFVPVKVDLSPGQDTPERRAALAGYAHQGLPLVVLHGADGEEAARVTRFVSPEDLLPLLQEVR